MLIGIIRNSIAALACTAIAALAVSCVKPNQVEPQSLKLEIVKTELPPEGGQQYVSISSNRPWTISSTGTWISFSKTSGDGDASLIMSCDANDKSEKRSCDVILVSGDLTRTVKILQDAGSQGGNQGGNQGGGTEVKPEPKTSAWLELPAVPSEAKDMYFVTHSMQMGKYNSRNFSYYYDADALVAIWVAYPLNNKLKGSGGRTNEWAYDPKLPRNIQPELYKGYRGGYDRGHQLPSADRLRRSENVTTFYFTNMTPQRSALNQHAWGELEGSVRNWANRFDTLYVVTGADIKGSKEYATDNVGKKVTVPVGYFKALLGYKASKTIAGTAATDGYAAVGFYYEHREYNSNVMSQSMTIDELETKTGLDFFVNLRELIGEDKYNKVESKVDNWWKNN